LAKTEFCWLAFEDPLRALLSFPRRRAALPFSFDELTPFAGVEDVSIRREPSLGGTGGLDEDEYRRWWMPRTASAWPEDRVKPGTGIAHAARRNDVVNMVVGTKEVEAESEAKSVRGRVMWLLM
jgi:hypothetical protein